MTAIEQITAVATNLGWNVEADTRKKKVVEFDFQRYTRMGQDFSFSIEMKGNDTESLVSGIEEFTRILTPTTKPICG